MSKNYKAKGKKNMISNDITLIIAEDDDIQYILIESYLKKSGIKNQIVRFHDGQKLQNFIGSTFSKERIQNNSLRCILIMDNHMPEKNGIEVLSYMKDNNLLDQIPTIMFSSCCKLETKTKCLNLGSKAFIKKPPSPDLIKSITDVAINFARRDTNQ